MYDNNMIMSLKKKKRKFEPRIKLNHNIYTDSREGYICVIGEHVPREATETEAFGQIDHVD